MVTNLSVVKSTIFYHATTPSLQTLSTLSTMIPIGIFTIFITFSGTAFVLSPEPTEQFLWLNMPAVSGQPTFEWMYDGHSLSTPSTVNKSLVGYPADHQARLYPSSTSSLEGVDFSTVLLEFEGGIAIYVPSTKMYLVPYSPVTFLAVKLSETPQKWEYTYTEKK
jgi:hypothetical protein